ncbi:MAG: hypothetical protein ACEPOW_04175 [Bacteroidales bacterium]
MMDAKFRNMGISSLLIASFLILLSACNPTTLTQVWKSPDYQGGPVEDIAIMAVFPSQGVSNRFEEIVSSEFQKAGIKTMLGYKIVNGKRKLSKKELDEALNKAGADDVLVFKFKGVEKQKTYYPPSVNVFPDFYYSYYRYWWYTYDVVRTPGYIQTDRWVQVESNLYQAKPDMLIWTGLSETINPDGVEKLAESIAKEVIRKLSAEGLIKANSEYLK